jgi:WD40 repeat protein
MKASFMQKAPLQNSFHNSDRKRRQLPRWLYSVVVAIIAVSIFIGAVFWIVSGQGVLATIISVIFTALGLIFSFLQVFPLKKASGTTANPSSTSHIIINVSDTPSSLKALSIQQEIETSPATAKIVPATSKYTDVSTYSNFMDWGEAPAIDHFYGRGAEYTELEQWILHDHCRIVLLLGMGGIGKTTLAAKVTEQLQGDFEYIFWRSLQNPLLLKDLLEQCILFFSSQQQVKLPSDANEQISILIGYLRKHHCLIVLDNLETIMLVQTVHSKYMHDYEDYKILLQRIGETKHQSCLLLTSREKPAELASLEGKISAVRMQRLSGLTEIEGKELLEESGLQGSDEAWTELTQLYSGNPLYLKIIAETIRELFLGNIDEFLKTGKTVLSDIRNPLEIQFARLSLFERVIMYWLAIEREAVSFQDLQADIIPSISEKALLESLASLRRRSLIEKNDASHFFLQPVIMEYMTEEFIERIYAEIMNGQIDFFGSHALIKALSKDYVRENQLRFILRPLAEKLVLELGHAESIERILSIVTLLRQMTGSHMAEYAGGNVLNLLIELGYDLRGADFSSLKIRQAFLQGINLQDTNFSRADFIQSTFTETFGIIVAVTFHEKAMLFAASGADGDIRQWHAGQYTPLLTYQGHKGWVFAIAFSHDGKMLASGAEDHTVRLWNTQDGHCLGILQHTHKIRSVAFSSDGKLLGTSGDSHSICLWDIGTQQCIQELAASERNLHRIFSIAFHPDGRTLASGGDDHIVWLWNVSSGQPCMKLAGHSGEIRSVAFHREGSMLASGSDDQTIRLWEMNTGNCLHTLTGHSNRVQAVAFNTDSSILASGSDDQTIRLWDVASGQCLKTLQGHINWVEALAFNGDVLASGSDDQTIRLWDVTSGQCLKTLQGDTHLVEAVAFSPDGQVLVSGSDDYTLHLWNPQSGACLKTLHGHTGCIRSIAFSPLEQIFASAGDDQMIRLWNLQAETCLKTLHGHTDCIWSIAFSPVEPLLASSGEDKTIRLWNIHTGHHATIVTEHTGWIWAITFSPDGKLLASGSDDKVVRLWNVQTQQCIAELQGHTKRVWSVAFNTDGTHLASGSEDGSVRIWDVQTQQCIATLPGHNAIVKSIAFLSNEKIVTSDWNLHIWDTNTINSVDIVSDHTDVIRCLAFCSHKNILASSSQDGTIKLWDVTTGACLKTLRNERLYERMDITGVRGLTETQKTVLENLGALSC